MQRIDQLSAPAVAGQFYLVPLVHGTWGPKTDWWVVMGSLHDDKKFFNFPHQHYHLDRRFVPAKRVAQATGHPLHGDRDGSFHRKAALSEVRWGRRKCLRSELTFPDWALLEPSIEALNESLAGAQCKSDEAGWICPHRGFHLGSVAPNSLGQVICPLHGLIIDATSGIVKKIRS
jgi:hypothetical protein